MIGKSIQSTHRVKKVIYVYNIITSTFRSHVACNQIKSLHKEKPNQDFIFFITIIGPLRFPFIGNVPQILKESKTPIYAFKKLADIYGDIMFLKMGPGDSGKFYMRHLFSRVLHT